MSTFSPIASCSVHGYVSDVTPCTWACDVDSATVVYSEAGQGKVTRYGTPGTVSVSVTDTKDQAWLVTIPTPEDGNILIVTPDYDGVPTLWHYAHGQADTLPLALLTEQEASPIVWARATAGVPVVDAG